MIISYVQSQAHYFPHLWPMQVGGKKLDGVVDWSAIIMALLPIPKQEINERYGFETEKKTKKGRELLWENII